VEWRPDNPAKGIERYKEQKRDRWLSDDELRRLCAVLNEHSSKRAANDILFQLLTGARLGEVLASRKEDFDLQRGVWTKPSHQTKRRRTEHLLPLSAQASTLIASIIETTDMLISRMILYVPPRNGSARRSLAFRNSLSRSSVAKLY
jgi:integrase